MREEEPAKVGSLDDWVEGKEIQEVLIPPLLPETLIPLTLIPPPPLPQEDLAILHQEAQDDQKAEIDTRKTDIEIEIETEIDMRRKTDTVVEMIDTVIEIDTPKRRIDMAIEIDMMTKKENLPPLPLEIHKKEEKVNQEKMSQKDTNNPFFFPFLFFFIFQK